MGGESGRATVARGAGTPGAGGRAWRRVLLLAAALAVAGGDPAAAVPPSRDRWVEIRTDSFTIYSNAPRRRALETGRQLERFRQALAHLTGDAALDSPIPTHIYLFKNEASFRPYVSGPDGRPGDEAGYFLGSSFGNYIALDLSAADSLTTARHEYVHSFTNHLLPGLPPWLQEGLAEFYSTFREADGRMEIGHPIDHHLAWLSKNPMIPLPELFAVGIDSPDFHEATRKGTFYAQSWALVHYLAASDPGPRGALGRFLTALERGDDPAAALLDAYSMSTAAMERELDRYVRQGKFRITRMPFEEPPAGGAETAEAMDRTEVLYRLADLLVHRRPLPRGELEAHLREGWKLDAEHAGLQVVAGLESQALGDRAAAARHYARAVAADPGNARAWSLAGWVRLQQFFAARAGVPAAPEGTPPELQEARESFRRSLELDPDHPESLAGFGKTFLFDTGDLREGMQALAEAGRALPGRKEIVLDRIVLAAHAGMREQAWMMLESSLRRPGDAELAAAAEDAVLAAEMWEAERLVRLQRIPAARESLSRAAARVTDPDRRAMVEAQIDALGHHQTDRATLVETFGAAVDAANEGDLEAAREGFLRVQALADDPGLRQFAGDSLRRVAAEVARRAWLKRLEEATALVAAGKLDDAKLIVEELLQEPPDDGLAAPARELLEEIRKLRPE